MMAMHSSKEFESDTVSGLDVMIFETTTCEGLLWGNNTLMAQSPCETIPINEPSSMTNTALTRKSRMILRTSATESVDRTEKMMLVFDQ